MFTALKVPRQYPLFLLVQAKLERMKKVTWWEVDCRDHETEERR